MLSIFNQILDLLFPPLCLSCNKFGQFYCEDCQQNTTFLLENICPDCLKVNPSGGKHKECGGFIDGLASCCSYEGVVQKYIKAIKYRYYTAGIDIFINYIIQKSQNFSPEFKIFLKLKPIIVPIPLHTKKRKIRGFNQSEKIAQILAKKLNLSISTQIIIRSRQTKPQSELTRIERMVNIKNAFSSSKQILKYGEKPLNHKNILLVDDIWTTGSTAQTCAKVLKNLGAEKVWVFTVAR